MAEAEREKQELHEEKLRAVESVEKHVRKQNHTSLVAAFQHPARFQGLNFTLYR